MYHVAKETKEAVAFTDCSHLPLDLNMDKQGVFALLKEGERRLRSFSFLCFWIKEWIISSETTNYCLNSHMTLSLLYIYLSCQLPCSRCHNVDTKAQNLSNVWSHVIWLAGVQRRGPEHCSSTHIVAKSLGHTLVTVSVTEYEEYLGSSATFAAYGPLKVRRLMVHHYISSRDPPPTDPVGPPSSGDLREGQGSLHSLCGLSPAHSSLLRPGFCRVCSCSFCHRNVEVVAASSRCPLPSF